MTTLHHLRSAVRETAAAISAGLATLSNRLAHLPVRGRGSVECCSAGWTTTTTFCSIDPVFATALPNYLADRSSETDFRIALMIHDLIPSIAPQYVTWNDDTAALAAIEIADTLIVNSEATEQDVRSFATLHHLALGRTVKLPMASALQSLDSARCPRSLRTIELTEGDFILCVGSVTIRKNHHLLLDVWQQLVESADPSPPPRLVIAGRLSWLCDETVMRMRLTPGFEGVVHHVPDASDEDLAWLYRNCAFTVFPSLYEGWGLPVSESLDFGKVCLTSDRTSLPEAGEGLAELLDPTDRQLWLERIVHYWTNPEARIAQEDRIAAGHRSVTPKEAADVILRVAQLQ